MSDVCADACDMVLRELQQRRQSLAACAEGQHDPELVDVSTQITLIDDTIDGLLTFAMPRYVRQRLDTPADLAAAEISRTCRQRNIESMPIRRTGSGTQKVSRDKQHNLWALRDLSSGRFAEAKASGGSFKGVRRER